MRYERTYEIVETFAGLLVSRTTAVDHSTLKGDVRTFQASVALVGN